MVDADNSILSFGGASYGLEQLWFGDDGCLIVVVGLSGNSDLSKMVIVAEMVKWRS